VVGNHVRVKVVKNKVAPPFKKAEFDILYGHGISKEGDLIELGVEGDIIQKSGAWYSFGDERLGQGKENVRDFLRENADLYARIEDKVLVHYGIRPADADAKPAEPEAAPAKPKAKPSKSKSSASAAG